MSGAAGPSLALRQGEGHETFAALALSCGARAIRLATSIFSWSRSLMVMGSDGRARVRRLVDSGA